MSSTMRYGYSNSGAVNAVVTLAVEHGYLSELGIDVELVEYPRTSDALEATMRREVDAVTVPGVAILRAALAGGDPVNVMNLEDQNVLALIAARHITTAEDLRGTTVGVIGLADQDYVVLHRAMRDCGLDPDADVTFRDYGHRSAVLAAVDRGEASAMCATVPTPIIARKLGLTILRDYRDTPEPYQCGATVTTRRFADEQPTLLRDFLTGLRKGMALFQSDADLALPHLKARSKLQDEDVLRETHRLFAEAVRHYVPTEAPLRAVGRDFEAATGTRIDLDFAALIDTSFVPAYDVATP